MAESFSREKLRQAPQKEGGCKILCYLLPVLLLFLTFSALVANPKKTTLYGGQSRSWSAEQGEKSRLVRPLKSRMNGKKTHTHT